jgi:hypothetical protein
MHPDDIARLFDRVTVGRPGRILYEPVLLAALDDAVCLEVHRDVYERSVAKPPDAGLTGMFARRMIRAVQTGNPRCARGRAGSHKGTFSQPQRRSPR